MTPFTPQCVRHPSYLISILHNVYRYDEKTEKIVIAADLDRSTHKPVVMRKSSWLTRTLEYYCHYKPPNERIAEVAAFLIAFFQVNFQKTTHSQDPSLICLLIRKGHLTEKISSGPHEHPSDKIQLSLTDLDQKIQSIIHKVTNPNLSGTLLSEWKPVINDLRQQENEERQRIFAKAMEEEVHREDRARTTALIDYFYDEE